MAQLGMNDWDNVLDIIYKANRHLDEFDRFRADVLHEIQSTIRTHSASFFLFDDNLRPVNPIATNLADKHLLSYQTHYHRINPFDPIYVRVPSRWVLLDTDVSNFSEFKSSSIYTEFLAPQQTIRQMMVYLKSNHTLLGFIGLHRSDEKDSFSDMELSIAEKIAPFISQSLEKAQLFHETKNRVGLINAFLNQLPVGLAILDMNFNALFQNRKAREIYSFFKRKHIPFHNSNTEQKSLPSAVYQTCSALKKRASIENDRWMPLSSTFSISLTTRASYKVHIEILNRQDARSSKSLFLISLYENLKTNHVLNDGELKNHFGLTAREIEIINYLFKGFKNSEIADLMKIKCGTVKNHLKKIFSKMGVSTRTSLIYEALAISNEN